MHNQKPQDSSKTNHKYPVLGAQLATLNRRRAFSFVFQLGRTPQKQQSCEMGLVVDKYQMEVLLQSAKGKSTKGDKVIDDQEKQQKYVM